MDNQKELNTIDRLLKNPHYSLSKSQVRRLEATRKEMFDRQNKKHKTTFNKHEVGPRDSDITKQ